MSGHEPLILWTGRHGSWAECDCGWLSRHYTTASGASVAWAHHLLDRIRRRETT